MKRFNPNFYLALLLIIAMIFSAMTIYAFGAKQSKSVNLSARSAALYVPEIDKFLFVKNAEEMLPMASTTKIMTAIIALENTDLADLVAIDDSAVGIEGSSAYLQKGDVLTMEELLYALLLQSANDAATAIAIYVAGNVDEFANLMNEKVTSLGLSDTNFSNPHGLDHEEHYTTAKDLAKIAGYALNNDTFRTIVSTRKKTFATEERSRTYFNHNKLLSLYNGCIGVKTGYTRISGRCLVGAAERDGLRFISVSLDAPNDWNDHKAMLDFGYESIEKIRLAESFDHIYKLPVINGDKENILVSNPDSCEIIVEMGEHNIDEQVKLNRYCIAPVRRGDIIGEVIYSLDGNKVGSVNLVAIEDANIKQKDGLFKRLINIFK